jgi:hypothetical protein
LNSEFKYFLEDNFDYLVRLYNRYIRYSLRKSTPIEYYASPYMNLTGYPSDKFIIFCMKYYNKKYNKSLNIKIVKDKYTIKLYLYFKMLFLFLFSFLFFTKNIKKNSIIIHGFHDDDNFKFSPYKTIKSPPLEIFKDKNIYHDINLSFISLKSLLKYKQNNIIFSLRFLSSLELIKLHYTAFKILLQSKSINKFNISYVDILYTLVKGQSISNLINYIDGESIYFNMWENRGYHLIIDFLIKDSSKSIFLDLGILFRVAPEYMMLNFPRHNLKSRFLFMSQFNYDLVKKNLGNIDYKLFKNYRIDCKPYNSKGIKNNILLISPLSIDVANKLYSLILDNKNKELNIKIRLHPYLNNDDFDDKYIEHRNIYEALDDYETIIYAGITTAAIELYFQGKKVFKFISNEFIDIDPLTDNALVSKISSLEEIKSHTKMFTNEDKEYYLGCNNLSLKKILKEIK